MALAKRNKPLGVWPNAATFSAGEPPYMVGEVTIAEAKEGICNSPSMAGRRSVLIAHRAAGSEWVPDLFLNADTGNSKRISGPQVKKYMNKRESNAPQNDPVEAQAPAEPEVVTPDPVSEVPEGELVLRVTPHVAELLRDAFTLVAAGRQVTIQTVQQPQQ